MAIIIFSTKNNGAKSRKAKFCQIENNIIFVRNYLTKTINC